MKLFLEVFRKTAAQSAYSHAPEFYFNQFRNEDVYPETAENLEDHENSQPPSPATPVNNNYGLSPSDSDATDTENDVQIPKLKLKRSPLKKSNYQIRRNLMAYVITENRR